MASTAASGGLRAFPRQFWIINSVELLERLAYYGALSITSLFLLHLGFSPSQVGLLMGLLLPLPYVVALLSGPLAEKYGYKPTILVSFVFYAAGYLILALATGGDSERLTVAGWTFPMYGVLFTAIISIGLGAGTFKPLPAASVAHTTTEAQRNLGYTIYYWAINVGAFIGPVAVYLLRGYMAAYIFAASVFGASFLFTLLLFRNPHEPDRRTNLLAAVMKIGPGFADFRFVLLLLAYSGFWFVYAMNFTFVTPYIDQFVPLPDWFSPNLQQAINPAVIILFGIPIGKFSEKVPPLRMMTLGIALFVAGFLLIGFTRDFVSFTIGIVVATIGEVLTQPGFLSLVSRIAPKDRVAIYQSMGFLPVAAGFMTGSFVGGAIYESLVDVARRPTLFWAIICSVGLFTMAIFSLYTGWATGAPKPAPMPAGPGPGPVVAPPPARRRAGYLLYALVAALLIPAVLAAGAVQKPGAPEVTPPRDVLFHLKSLQGTLGDGQTATHPVRLPRNWSGAIDVVLVLNWTDETAPQLVPGSVNAPDRFLLTVKDRAGSPIKDGDGLNTLGGDGHVEVVFPMPADRNFTVEITLYAHDYTYAGQAKSGSDVSNDWNLDMRGQRRQAT